MPCPFAGGKVAYNSVNPVSLAIRQSWILFGAMAIGWGATAQPAMQYHPQEILVKYRQDARPRRALAANSPADQLIAGAVHKATLTDDGWHLLGLPDGLSVEAALALVKQKAEVESAEPNLFYRFPDPVSEVSGNRPPAGPVAETGEASDSAPNDPLYSRLWGLDRIGAPEAWKLTKGSREVVVAVFDTGVDYTHPDLAPNMWHNPGEIPGNRLDDDRNGFRDDVHGVNVVSGSGDPMDRHGHGTHVAGTIGAVGSNALGVVGVNWNVKILAVKVAREYDGAFTGDLVRGLDYLTALKKRGVNLVAVNHSWGGPYPSEALSQAFARLAAAGVVNVAAAGNRRLDTVVENDFPSNYNFPGMIAVAAIDPGGHLADFTSFGGQVVDVAAPGVFVWSTLPGGRYGAWAGTSMATPHVTGAVGLLYALRPDLSPEQVRHVLRATVDRLPAFDRDRVASGGRINVARAAQWLVDQVPLPNGIEPAFVPRWRMNLESQSPGGFQADGESTEARVSEDGRFVVFLSDASNLVDGEDGRFTDVFVRDWDFQRTVRVSRTPEGASPRLPCSSPAISGDGSVVAFITAAGNLIPDETGSNLDVILWARSTGALESVSRPDPGQAAGRCDSPSLSRNGQRVVFVSWGALVAGDTNGLSDIYLRDRESKTLQVVSVIPTGAPSSGSATDPAISADGRYVAFVSYATDLTEGDTNPAPDVFVRDLATGITECVSVSTTGEISDGISSGPRISGDGRWVAFESTARNLDPTVTSSGFQIFLRDREARTTILVTRSASGEAIGGAKGSIALDGVSADGRWVLFRCSSVLLPPDSHPSLPAMRLYAFDRLVGDIVALAYNDAGLPALRPPSWMNLNEPLVSSSALSADGRHVVLSSVAWNLSPGEGDRHADVFHLDRGAVSLDLSVALGDSESETGRGLVGPDLDQTLNHRRTDGEETSFRFRLVNRGSTPVDPGVRVELAPAEAVFNWPEGAYLGTGEVWQLPILEPGADLVIPVTLAAPMGASMGRVRLAVGGLSAGPGPRGSPLLLQVTDRVTAMVTTPLQAPGIEWISQAKDGGPLARHAENPSVSADGSRVVFHTHDDNVMDTDANEAEDVFLWDRFGREPRVVSARGSIPNASDWSEDGQITPDGRFVIFQSYANNLGPDSNYERDVFLKVLDSSALQLISRRKLVYSNYESSLGSISEDGRFVAFSSHATRFAADDTNEEEDVFVFDRETQEPLLISRTPDGRPGNGDSFHPIISGNGRFVAFASMADDLTSEADDNHSVDVFIWDAATGEVELLTIGENGAARGQSRPVSVSAEGRFVLLTSDAPDLPGRPTDGHSHYYLLDRATGRLPAIDHWLPTDSPPWDLSIAALSSDAEWLTLTLRRTVGQGGAERLQTRIELVHRTHGDRRIVAEGERGPGAPVDGFSEVTAWNGLVGGRFQAFMAEGREGRAFVRQVYLYDRAQPGVEALAGREAESLRRLDSKSPSAVLRELTVLVTPGQPSEFRLVLHNSGDMSDTLELAVRQPDEAWDIQVRPSAAAEDDQTLTLPARFASVPAVGDVFLTGRLMLQDGHLPTPIDLTLGSLSNHRVTERIRIQPLLDEDGDRMADVWETTHFGDLITANEQTDADGDGVLDTDEFTLGSDPKVATPPLQVTRIEALPEGRVRLGWPTVPDRFYTVEVSPSGSAPFERLSVPIVGAASGLELIDDAGGERPSGIYRVRADLP